MSEQRRGAGSCRDGRSRRLVGGLLGVALLLGPQATAHASMGDLEEPSDIVEVEGLAHRGLVFRVAAGRRLGVAAADAGGINSPPTELHYFDLDSGALRGSTILTPSMWRPLNAESPQRPGGAHVGGRDEALILDNVGDRAFVAYGISAGPYNASTSVQTHHGTIPENAQKGQLCTGGMRALNGGWCVGGIHVVDLGTQEILRSIPMSPLRVDTPGLSTSLRAMAYVPADSAGAPGGKVLLLVEDLFAHTDGSNAPATTSGNTRGRVTGSNLHYLVQFDPERGIQEWAIRLESCRGSRDHNDDPQNWNARAQRPHHSAIMPSVRAEDRAIYVGCYSGSNQTTHIVRVPLGQDGAPAFLPVSVDNSGTVLDTTGGGQGGQRTAPAAPAERQNTWIGADGALEFIADPLSGRMLVRTNMLNTDMWWVFDSREASFVGAIGIGQYHAQGGEAGLDPMTGRFYARMWPKFAGDGPPRVYVADIRSTPLGQALLFPLTGGAVTAGDSRIEVESGAEGRPPRLYSVAGRFEDRTPPPGAVSLDDPYTGKTHDVDEVDGLTAAAFDGAARGFGARGIFVGGLGPVARFGPADPYNNARFSYAAARDGVGILGIGPGIDKTLERSSVTPDWPQCADSNREVVLAAAGTDAAASLNGGGSSGSVRPLVLDGGTGDDAQAPVGRCSPADWDATWQSALFGRAPAAEPHVLDRKYWDGDATCVSDDSEPAETWSDPVASAFSGSVNCGPKEASGWSYARGSAIAPTVTVSEALSSFRIYLDPGRGIVARVESVARGVDIEGVVQIDTVRGSAESWANGRAQSVAEAEREAGYDANCDAERTAGTCFVPHLFGARTPGYSCGPCGNEDALVEGLSRALGTNATVRLRKPDPDLARGSVNGYIAAIQRPDAERFADLMMNADLLPTTLPTLEIVRYASPVSAQVPAHQGPKDYVAGPARQIYQFAGVEVSSSYSIQCLAVHDEAAGTCTEAVDPPGSLTIALTDPDGKPLAGGAFEVRRDVDADGVIGLADELLPDGACVTGDDGVGACVLEALVPGSYLVIQTAAPASFSKVEDVHMVELASGEARTVTFVNASNIATIGIAVTDEGGKPLAGASFAAYPDPDADGKVAAGAEPAATCTSGPDGSCTMRVPTGSYVLVQTSAPSGLEPIEPVAFMLISGGQTASVDIVNYPPDPSAMPAAPAPSVDYTTPSAQHPVIETVTDSVSPSEGVTPPPMMSLPEQVGGTIVRIVRAPAEVLRLVTRDPRQAAAWAASLAVLALAVTAVRRRHRTLDMLLRQARVGSYP